MGIKSGASKERHHVFLNSGDWEWLATQYASVNITPSSVIAKLVSSFRRKVENRLAATTDTAPKPEPIELELSDD